MYIIHIRHISHISLMCKILGGVCKMATSARIYPINEVAYDNNAVGKEWVLCLQWCRYVYDDGSEEKGFRFIWRRPDGTLQAARGQARIPDLNMAAELMERAKQLGWGHNASTTEKVDNR